jgi:hypothetical protein
MHGELKEHYVNEARKHTIVVPSVKDEPIEDVAKRLREKGLI